MTLNGFEQSQETWQWVWSWSQLWDGSYQQRVLLVPLSTLSCSTLQLNILDSTECRTVWAAASNSTTLLGGTSPTETFPPPVVLYRKKNAERSVAVIHDLPSDEQVEARGLYFALEISPAEHLLSFSSFQRDPFPGLLGRQVGLRQVWRPKLLLGTWLEFVRQEGLVGITDIGTWHGQWVWISTWILHCPLRPVHLQRPSGQRTISFGISDLRQQN